MSESFYPLVMPNRPGPISMGWAEDTVVSVSRSPFTHAESVTKWPGQKWVCTVEMPPMRLPLAKEWMAFFSELNGQEGTFILRETRLNRRPDHLNLGTPTVDGNHLGGPWLGTQGWTPNVDNLLEPGDWISVGGRLRRVNRHVHSDEAGKARISIWPHAYNVADGADVEWKDPTGIFRIMEAPNLRLDVNRMGQGFSFSCTEAIDG